MNVWCSEGNVSPRFSFSLHSAGVFCAVISHPADSVVSVLNKEKGSSAIQVLKRLGPRGESVCTHTHTLCFEVL